MMCEHKQDEFKHDCFCGDCEACPPFLAGDCPLDAKSTDTVYYISLETVFDVDSQRTNKSPIHKDLPASEFMELFSEQQWTLYREHKFLQYWQRAQMSKIVIPPVPFNNTRLSVWLDFAMGEELGLGIKAEWWAALVLHILVCPMYYDPRRGNSEEVKLAL
jgi:hypothetical protein